MSSDTKDPGSPQAWLASARSDLELAQVPRSEGILREALCFHAQQAAEKALKALLIACGIPFPKTHNIKTLLERIPDGHPLPDEVLNAAGLTDYAVLTRYPGDYEPVDEDEHREAVESARAVLQWVQRVVAALGGDRA